jgi:hypothetical protein
MYQKYKKYENAYLDQKYLKIQVGGMISSFNQQRILETRSPDKIDGFCEAFESIELIKNEGRHNLGIMFINDEGNELFLKFGRKGYLFNDFKVGFALSLLKHIYPYFLNVYGYTECLRDNPVDHTKEEMDVLVVEKGTMTLWKYLAKHIYKYMLSILPDYESIVDTIEKNVETVLNENGINIDDEGNMFINIGGTSIQTYLTDKVLYQKIIDQLTDNLKPYIDRIQRAYYKFDKEFTKQIIKNVRVIQQNFMLIDMITLSYYGQFIGDKKYDNFMIITKPFDPTRDSEFIEIKLRDDKILLIPNVIKWSDTDMESIYIYPVDFGSAGDIPDFIFTPGATPEMTTKISKSTIDHFMQSIMNAYPYSDSYPESNMSGEFRNILHKFTGIHIAFARKYITNDIIRRLENENFNFGIDLYKFTNPKHLKGCNILHTDKLIDIFTFAHFIANHPYGTPFYNESTGWNVVSFTETENHSYRRPSIMPSVTPSFKIDLSGISTINID